MGVGTRKARAKSFKQEVDKAVTEEVKDGTLFSGKPVEQQIAVECFRDPEDANVPQGVQVLLIDLHDQIDVFIGTTVVGYVTPSAVAELRAIFKLDQTPHRSVRGRVVDVSALTPTFVVVIN